LENKVFAKAAWRIVPFMMLLYVANFLDRVNVGFAALTMNRDLAIGAEAFGIVGGIFFIGYFFFEVPSNVILEKVGARLWIFRIMLTWGLVSMATAFVRGAESLSVLRFLLGVAEAGFFPGVIFYLGLWFPAAVRARFVGLFLSAIAIANIVGAPISSLILGMDGVGGLRGWQWLFLLEGLPSFVLAFGVLVWLPNGPKDARWLNDDERAQITARLASEPAHTHHALLPMLRDPRVWALAIPDFGIVLSTYGVGLWLPQIVKGLGFSNLGVGMVVAFVYLVSSIATILWCLSSDRAGERVRHVAIAAVIGAGGLIVAAFTQGSIVCVLALAVGMSGTLAAISVFWALPSSFLGQTAAAGGIALINSLANLAGFAGPYLMGWLKTATGGYAAGLGVLGGGLLMTAVTILLVGRTLDFRVRARAFDKFAPPV
jgi:ACS family tartrate transporter-like MFS transporter